MNDRKAFKEALCSRDICDILNEQYIILESSLIKGNTLHTILRDRDGLQNKLVELENVHRQVLILSTDTNELKWMKSRHVKFNKIINDVEVFICDEKLKRTKNSIDQNIKLEKLPLPMFDGNIRNYARFTNDFKELVLPSVPPQKAAYALRCLPSSIQQLLGLCKDNARVMLERLDKRYSHPGKIVDCIISEIRGFKKLDTDDVTCLVKFVNILDTAYLDLKKLGLSHELENANIVSLIESKLPRHLELERYRHLHRKDSNVDKTNKFPALLEFLRLERDVLEYATSDLRSSVKYVVDDSNKGKNEEECLVHRSHNHSTERCRTYLNMSINERYNLLKDNTACFGCLKSGHMLQNCTQRVPCGDGCDSFHHKTLRTSQVNGTLCTVTDYSETDGEVILPVMRIKVGGRNCKYITTLWDSAATISLITHRKAASCPSNYVL